MGWQKLTLQKVQDNLQKFIKLSLLDDETSWDEWISATSSELSIECWERMQCKEENCPAYQSECKRCWLIAGTMCGDEVHGKFATKYSTCCNCRVFRELTEDDPALQLQENILILIHSLRVQQQKLKTALAEVETLSGLLPICMYCKKIRNDEGYWNELESCLNRSFGTSFTHSVCPDCLAKKHPDVAADYPNPEKRD
ncbi:MAG: hypothetical protein P8Y63_13845 [Deltaproteobacteria bacterium]|jgi:hypothetical protein